MNVLLLEFDLFRAVGGGQTFYRSIIETNPQIRFFYFRRAESAGVARPPNAFAIDFRQHYSPRHPSFTDPLDPTLFGDFVVAMNAACSARGHQFDLVDSPDYDQYGSFILPALEHHGISCQRRVLSLHGVISRTIATQWPGAPDTETAVRLAAAKEKLQYLAADIRYGISVDYVERWFLDTGSRPYYFHPAHFMKRPEVNRDWPRGTPVDLNFVGRKDKGKGPDLFIDLLWNLQSMNRGVMRLIGGEVPIGARDTRQILSELAENRKLDVAIEPSYPRERLLELFGTRSVTVLPSRWDTLNLIALESLFSGCPTVIGSGAGVCRLLQESFPTVPFIRLDVEDPSASVDRVEKLLADYDNERTRLAEGLRDCAWEPDSPTLSEIYGAAATRKRATDDTLHKYFRRFLPSLNRRSARNLLDAPLEAVAKRSPIGLDRNLPGKVRPYLGIIAGRLFFPQASPELIEQVGRSSQFQPGIDGLRRMPNGSSGELEQKRAQAAALVPLIRLDRARLFREFAEIERRRGKELTGAAYELRLMRWLGRDRFSHFINTQATLSTSNYEKEATAAAAIIGSVESQLAILQAARTAHDLPTSPDFTFMWDRRGRVPPRVAVIVSLYKAESKIPEFLRRMSRQTLLRADSLEMIFVDSCSPENELGAVRAIAEQLSIPYLYVRTQQRETIQKAWNRGIGLARAPYLAFLGVDETDHPECLEILSNELDRHPEIDWVQGSNMIAAVSPSGAYLADVMPYERPLAAKWAHYLDCTYLSYVAGLYRKSIHDRFGFYDESFGAAGDNEFKNRILPFIRTRTLNLCLGQYLNYPDERTTASPRAEIEDTRAWYLHRTPGGMDYAFPAGSEDEAIGLLLAALGYRKCYLRHTSTDIELASSVLAMLGSRVPEHPIHRIGGEVATIREIYRTLQFLARPSSGGIKREIMIQLFHLKRASQSLAVKVRRFDKQYTPCFGVFNDNQFEQHHWAW